MPEPSESTPANTEAHIRPAVDTTVADMVATGTAATGTDAAGSAVTDSTAVDSSTTAAVAGFQDLIARTYGERDGERGIPSTVAWLTEELGELAQAVRKGTKDAQEHEIGDVIAWVFSLANQLDIDVAQCLERYSQGCPKCGQIPCGC